MHVLHAIHDFLPRHRAGSEIYVQDLARTQLGRHHVTVLCGEYDPGRPHGHVAWRVHDSVPVVEVVNNWVVASFEDTYRPPLIARRLDHLLQTLRPDVVHVHNLLNLSFDLPALAKARGIPVVATLHDYTLVCPSGGQRIHRQEEHLCREIDPSRCVRCFPRSPFHAQMSFAALTARLPRPGVSRRAAKTIGRFLPGLARRAQRLVGQTMAPALRTADVEARLDAARRLLTAIDLVVAPSRAMAREFVALGLPPERIDVSDYGFTRLPASPRPSRAGLLRIGFVGTLVWHKGPHVLLQAARQLPADTFEIRIFGSTDTFPAYTADLRRLASGLPVRFMGAFDRQDVPGVYADLDVLVVPSLWLENSPLVIHEACMAGVPVVGARIGGIPDLVTGGENGLLYDASSPASLADALRRLIDDPALVASFAARLPRVKAIEDDAAEWDARYRQVTTGIRLETVS